MPRLYKRSPRPSLRMFNPERTKCCGGSDLVTRLVSHYQPTFSPLSFHVSIPNPSLPRSASLSLSLTRLQPHPNISHPSKLDTLTCLCKHTTCRSTTTQEHQIPHDTHTHTQHITHTCIYIQCRYMHYTYCREVTKEW